MKTHSSRLIVRAACLLALLLGSVACQFLPGILGPTAVPTPTFPGLPPTPTATPRPPDHTATPNPSPILVSKVFEESSSAPAYTIKISYPFMQGAADARFNLFNSQVDLLVKGVAAGFKKDVASYYSTPDANLPGSYLDSSYSVTYGRSGLISVLFKAGYYMSGAAHPNSYFISLNLDLYQQKVLKLADLMQPDVDYLAFLSTYCTQDLLRQGLIESEVTAGAAPKEENFRSWNITASGLEISFDPYQVAAYALGPQKVSIPYRALKPVLNSSGPLAPLLQ